MTAETLSSFERDVLLAAATAAPSVHNSQPWRFAVAGRQVSLFADPRRQLGGVDAEGRQLLISCGAALFNLRLAARHLGVEPRIRLLPDPARPTLVAQVSLAGRPVARGLSERLYEAIQLRHTNRYPFEDGPVAVGAIAAMIKAARLEGADLLVPQEEAERGRLAELVRAAEEARDADPSLAAEAALWTGVDSERRDGVPGYALGPLSDDPGATVRDLRRGAPVAERPVASFEPHPVLAILFTSEDDHASWVRAGVALQRVLLSATLYGLAASFVNQALEVPDTRRQVLEGLAARGYPQMLMRLGRGVPVPATPRLPLHEIAELTDALEA